MWPVVIAGFALGAAGSLHCVGMCGPLSLALPVHHLSQSKKFLCLLGYQFGRIFTYSIIGLLFGVAGRRIYIAGYQQAFSITMGALILLFSCFFIFRKRVLHLKWLNGFHSFIQQQIASLLKSANGLRGFFLMGIANGLLPCGMIYVALASTLTFTTVAQSVLFMAMFGAGTLPAMMIVGYAGRLIKPTLRLTFRKMVPAIISVMGILLILRGLNLGIPFISPSLPVAPGNVIECQP